MTHRYTCFGVASALILALSGAAAGAELDLKSLQPIESKKKKSGAYVGVFAGTTISQAAEMELQYVGRSIDYNVADHKSDLLVGLEVGYSWKTPYPVEVGLEFEGFFGSTELNSFAAAPGPQELPRQLSDVATANADLNYVVFMLNGTLTADLRKFPQLGPIMPRFRPYLGAGIGGAQLFYRNQEVQTEGDLTGTPTAPSVTPFGIDEFVFASQLFVGLEYKVTEKVGIYGEFRRLYFAKTNDLDSFHTDVAIGGLHLRY